ncbi:DsrE family protein [Flavihumibacter rivuli]|uniref:DsrE family protein n=1 Tax=Flavihumibacter rivuli TaxID=2838156 RepID=UPI001BDED016|nr:DsrE family protein [Flavihumibacter rivuli]ULQ57602.1 DsrE family protein [Flavihumibacter rivuli]
MYKIVLTATVLLAMIGKKVADTSKEPEPNQSVPSQQKVSSQTVETGSSKAKHKVVLHLTSNDTAVWRGMIKNITNLKAGWKDDVQIEVVAHGPGIYFLVQDKTTQQASIHEFRQMGISFMGCENTLRERKIDRASLVPDAGTVPMGIGEVIMKQEEGWSYIKITN